MPTTGVEAIETHMSWVFLTDRQAWKLKKPVRYDYLDFSTVELRRVHCAEEIRLNRRLTHGVYLDTVPLTVDDHGRLRLGSGGTVVDWLVRMQRLPRARMLDQAIRRGRVPLGDVRSAIRRLCAFYAGCPPIPMTPAEYRERLAREIAANRRDLAATTFALQPEIFDATCERLAAFVEREPALFEARVRSGRILEGHGDLRPEHVCLLPEPQIIDCLEFSRDFRILDTADELGFLALECERLGAPELRRVIFETYARESGDAPPAALVHFYSAHRACMRAKVALWHMNEPAHRDSPVWPALARTCLRLAREHIERCR
jgi:aminoglycoside phosphotransferase family enzyme